MLEKISKEASNLLKRLPVRFQMFIITLIVVLSFLTLILNNGVTITNNKTIIKGDVVYNCLMQQENENIKQG